MTEDSPERHAVTDIATGRPLGQRALKILTSTCKYSIFLFSIASSLLLGPLVARAYAQDAGVALDAGGAPSSEQTEGTRDETGATVIGSLLRTLERNPGSVSLVRREDLRQLAPQHAGDALRTVPGVNVTAEDGIGLRLNIGIRGMDPNRSRQVLVLEDGVPISLNPYGSPELYYSPPIERIERIEVIRGSGQILYGPQTLGGVINYITRDPPRQLSMSAETRYGTYGYMLAQAGVGATQGAVGWQLDLMHRRFDGPRRLDLALTDVTGRLRLQLAPRTVLRVKVNYYNEGSRATYLGVTTAQFARDPTINTAENDRFVVERYALALGLTHRFSDAAVLVTNFYSYETDRAWRRQEYDRADAGADYERICDPTGFCGQRSAPELSPTNDGGTVFYRRSAAIRNRVFGVLGVEPRLTFTWSAPRTVSGELIALVRLHHERAREQVLVGASPTTESGDARNEEHRNGFAIAAAIQHRFTLWRRLHVIPGLRVENFWSDRRVVRAPTTTPGGVIGSDVNIFGRAFTSALIPGLGVAIDLAGPFTLFAGVHRGYAPPRTKDAVSSAGVNLQLDPELSWNSELGARLRLGRWLSADLAGFHIEFENLIIPPAESNALVSGGGFSAGHSRHSGLEASTTFDLAQLSRHPSFALPLTVNYTWLPRAALVGGLFDGNRLPYAPEHLLYAQLRFVHRVGLSAQVGASYVTRQFADRENTPFASADGLVGELPSYFTLDARVAYTWRRTGLTFSVTGRGITDQIYIANRAPQGIQPAGFRQVFTGLEWAWPGS